MVDIVRAVAEFVGTFVFLFVILQSGAVAGATTAVQPFIIVAGLLVAIFMFGSLTGGHFNPHSKTHGAPNAQTRHVGDLGNVVADASGSVSVVLKDDQVSMFGPLSVIGRSV